MLNSAIGKLPRWPHPVSSLSLTSFWCLERERLTLRPRALGVVGQDREVELAEGIEGGDHAVAPLSWKPQGVDLFGVSSSIHQAFTFPPIDLQ